MSDVPDWLGDECVVCGQPIERLGGYGEFTYIAKGKIGYACNDCAVKDGKAFDKDLPHWNRKDGEWIKK